MEWGDNALPLAQRSAEPWCETLDSPVNATKKSLNCSTVLYHCIVFSILLSITHIGHCYYTAQLLKQVIQYNTVINGEAWQ